MLDASLCTAANSRQKKKKTEKGPLLRFFLRGGGSCTQAIGWLKTRSPKTTARLIQNNVYCFFILNNISAGHSSLLQIYRCY